MDISKEEWFYELKRRWKHETAHLSNGRRIVSHPAYQEIIDMGMDAIPFILRDLEKHGPDHLFFALSKITGVNPVPPEVAGYMGGMTEAWLEWGRNNGYLPAAK